MTSSSNRLRSRPSAASTVLATVAGNLYLVAGTLVFSVVAFLFSWLPPRGWVVSRCARAWSRGVLLASGCRLETSFVEALDRGRNYIFVANHQSLYDIPALLVSAPVDLRFMAKRSLFQIPIFGWALRAGGFVSIDRGSSRRAQSGFNSALRALRAGASFLVFPEGTRSLDGRLLPLKRGGLLLALRSGIPMVPVGIRGTLGIRTRGSYRIRPGRAIVRYGRPLDPADYGVRAIDRLEAELRERISALAELDG